ncbi:MAG: M20/M25/M40 family metallo-hydrolase [Anaerolineae bacterium]
MVINPVSLLRQLVEIKSVSREEQAAVKFLVAQIATLGLVAHVDEAGNAVGVRECPDENGRITHEIVLLGHIDTVPGEIEVRVENGRLYGRGTVDAKGPLAAFVMAAAGAQLPPGTRVVVIGAVEEEAATSKGALFAARK